MVHLRALTIIQNSCLNDNNSRFPDPHLRLDINNEDTLGFRVFSNQLTRHFHERSFHNLGQFPVTWLLAQRKREQAQVEFLFI